MLFCKKEYPIIVLCKNRLRYLDATLRSLSATTNLQSQVYVVNDGSDNPHMVRYLTTNERIPLTKDLFPNDSRWNQISGDLPNFLFAKGIRSKTGIMLFKKSKYIRNFSHAVKLVFERHNCSHIIRVEGDVLFKQGWHQRFIQIIGQSPPNVGLISGFRHIFDNPVLKDNDNHTQNITRGTTGSQLYAISRTLCRKDESLVDNESDLKEGADDFWFDGCRKANMERWVTSTSMCQHIGYKSEVYKGRKEFMVSDKHGVRAIDPNIFPPYAMEDEVSDFSNSCCEEVV